jgi:hypothetical protein
LSSKLFTEALTQAYGAALAKRDAATAELIVTVFEASERWRDEDPFPPNWKPGRSEVGLYYGVTRRGDVEVGMVVCGRCLRVPLEAIAMRAARVRPMRATDFEYTGSVEPQCQRCGRRPLDG